MARVPTAKRYEVRVLDKDHKLMEREIPASDLKKNWSGQIQTDMSSDSEASIVLERDIYITTIVLSMLRRSHHQGKHEVILKDHLGRKFWGTPGAYLRRSYLLAFVEEIGALETFWMRRKKEGKKTTWKIWQLSWSQISRLDRLVEPLAGCDYYRVVEDQLQKNTHLLNSAVRFKGLSLVKPQLKNGVRQIGGCIVGRNGRLMYFGRSMEFKFCLMHKQMSKGFSFSFFCIFFGGIFDLLWITSDKNTKTRNISSI